MINTNKRPKLVIFIHILFLFGLTFSTYNSILSIIYPEKLAVTFGDKIFKSSVINSLSNIICNVFGFLFSFNFYSLKKAAKLYFIVFMILFLIGYVNLYIFSNWFELFGAKGFINALITLAIPFSVFFYILYLEKKNILE